MSKCDDYDDKAASRMLVRGVLEDVQKTNGESKGKETINHPDRYNTGCIEVIDAIEDWKLGFHLGNAIKYIARSSHKGDASKDLRKAIWYIERHLRKEESE